MTKIQRNCVIDLLLQGLQNTRIELEIAWSKNDKDSAFLVDSLLIIEKNLCSSLFLLGATPPKREKRVLREDVRINKQTKGIV